LSYEAIRWALRLPIEKSSAKLVLVAMADCVNSEAGDMLCWPSYKHLTDITGQDAKTVEAGLRRLREAGYITDTRQRKGTTGQVVVYRLNTPEFGAVETDRKTPVFPVKTPVFPMKDPQISGERPPKTGDGIRNGIRNGTKKEVEDKRLSALPPSVLADYMKVRKAKRAGEFTTTAIDGMEREALKAGLSLADAVRVCAEFGWQGFNAGWYEQRMAKRPSSTETAYQRSMREKWEVATGRNKLEVINGDARLLG
jgi:DNA-binding transcriptional ArsR family regulator